MSLNIAYKYKVQVPEVSQRKLEGLKVKRRYPGKIPVSPGALPLDLAVFNAVVAVVTLLLL